MNTRVYTGLLIMSMVVGLNMMSGIQGEVGIKTSKNEIIYKDVSDINNEIKNMDSEVNFDTLNKYQVKDQMLRKFIKEHEREKGEYLYETEDYYYFLIAAGQRGTGGYSVKVKSVVLDGDSIKVQYQNTEPAPGNAVTTAITYPIAIVKISKEHNVEKIYGEEIEETIVLKRKF